MPCCLLFCGLGLRPPFFRVEASLQAPPRPLLPLLAPSSCSLFLFSLDAGLQCASISCLRVCSYYLFVCWYYLFVARTTSLLLVLPLCCSYYLSVCANYLFVCSNYLFTLEHTTSLPRSTPTHAHMQREGEMQSCAFALPRLHQALLTLCPQALICIHIYTYMHPRLHQALLTLCPQALICIHIYTYMHVSQFEQMNTHVSHMSI